MWQEYEERALPALCEPIMRSPLIKGKRGRSDTDSSVSAKKAK